MTRQISLSKFETPYVLRNIAQTAFNLPYCLIIMRFLERLEDPMHPSLGPTLWVLNLWRLWQPTRSSPFLIYNFVHILGTLMVVSEYVELWFIKDDLDLVSKNLSKTMLSSIGVAKTISFILWHEQWKSVIEYVSSLEKLQLLKKDRITTSVIDAYTKYSRIIAYSYWCLVTSTVFLVLFAPLCEFLSSADTRYLMKNGTLPYPEVISSWLPFDRTRGYGYWISVVEQSAMIIYGAGVVATFDSNAFALMSFFHGQLKLLGKNCERLFGVIHERISYDEAMKRITECHYHHKRLIQFSSILNSLLSPVMFLYVIICSMMICASAIQLSTQGTGTMQTFWIAEYLMALIVQLFFYCWHCNEVLHMSDNVQKSVYASAWWTQNDRIRRSVLLLGGQLRKRIVFTAGPFTDLNVATFVTIIKASYSYYTLLTQK